MRGISARLPGIAHVKCDTIAYDGPHVQESTVIINTVPRSNKTSRKQQRFLRNRRAILVMAQRLDLGRGPFERAVALSLKAIRTCIPCR